MLKQEFQSLDLVNQRGLHKGMTGCRRFSVRLNQLKASCDEESILSFSEGRAINRVPLAFNSFFLAIFYSAVVRGTNVLTPSIDLVGRAATTYADIDSIFSQANRSGDYPKNTQSSSNEMRLYRPIQLSSKIYQHSDGEFNPK
ncbi:hypothetical protein Tco_0955230 [Tanacetum coccineum]|uniref:Uncharacterized protein n=1 Tax=Tanacetum coccineum TaxID=301880 RepID=A0ABQ5E6L5_9ASTR